VLIRVQIVKWSEATAILKRVFYIYQNEKYQERKRENESERRIQKWGRGRKIDI
jgi:hypothetical protein